MGGIDFSKPVLLGYSGLSDALLLKYIEDSRHIWEDNLKEHSSRTNDAPNMPVGKHSLCLPTLSYLKAPFFAQSSVRCLESEF